MTGLPTFTNSVFSAQTGIANVLGAAATSLPTFTSSVSSPQTGIGDVLGTEATGLASSANESTLTTGSYITGGALSFTNQSMK
jgi:hypothetical protein